MRFLKLAVLLVISLGLAAGASAQPYPSKPVRVIVPFGAGSGSDVLVRYVMEFLGQNLNQRFVVDNRPGANGNIGLVAGATSAPDGYTLVSGGLGSNAMNQFLYPPGGMGLDPEKDLDTVLLLARLPFVIAVSPSFPPNNIQELIAVAKAKPNSVNVAITQSTTRMVFELFNSMAGVQLFGVPYKATGTALTDVFSGRVPVAIETAASLRPHVASGKLKPLAITSRSGSDLMPGLKSVAEQGIADFEFVGWVSLYMPKGSPREAITLINTELNKILAKPETKKRFLELGLEPGSGSPQDLAKWETSERARWGPIIKAAGLTAQ